tara:strand:+ start:262 stop:699 length:438 start_codon:yes stop_codon:yes gene_type:complete
MRIKQILVLFLFTVVVISCGNNQKAKTELEILVETKVESTKKKSKTEEKINVVLESNAVVTYTSQDLIGNYMSKSNVPLTIKKDNTFTWAEAGGTWNYSLDKGVFTLIFEDYYGNVTNATLTFKNKDEFGLSTEAYGDESYTRIK